MFKNLLTVLLICLVTVAYAQQREIVGKITGADGAPVPYATVQLKGTTRGTTADQNGNFRLQVDGNDAILQVRSVGFTTKEITVGSNSNVAISLTQDNTALQEVVVTG
ncbi:MAG TPA: carboxypeptidase-like regulatory domain-containing protein, partial [Chitinophaga sp.]|nr:carboxypeptidase-like regulatory domain-containing protein [Chitinophaga sp.]